MNKRERRFLSVIGIGVVLGAGVTFKAYQYREKLIETKKVVAKKDKMIVEKDEKILESVKLGYEATTRLFYLDVLRTYSIRHPYGGESDPDFKIALTKSAEAHGKYIDFLESLGYKDGKLTKIINKENTDFSEISDKSNALYDLMDEEDKKSKK